MLVLWAALAFGSAAGYFDVGLAVWAGLARGGPDKVEGRVPGKAGLASLGFRPSKLKGANWLFLVWVGLAGGRSGLLPGRGNGTNRPPGLQTAQTSPERKFPRARGPGSRGSGEAGGTPG